MSWAAITVQHRATLALSGGGYEHRATDCRNPATRLRKSSAAIASNAGVA